MSLASAIVEGALERGLTLSKPENFRSIPGQGVTGTVDGRVIAAGNASMIDGSSYAAEMEPLRERGEGPLI